MYLNTLACHGKCPDMKAKQRISYEKLFLGAQDAALRLIPSTIKEKKTLKIKILIRKSEYFQNDSCLYHGMLYSLYFKYIKTVLHAYKFKFVIFVSLLNFLL
jgi:hypothetical protein